MNEPHAVLFWREYREELQAGQPLAGYVTTTVVSPDERDAVIWFQSGGPAKLYLNGRKVDRMPVRGEEGVPPFFRRPRRTPVVRLRAGENTLVVDTRPSSSEWPIWFFGAAVVTPDGDPMTDLAFE